jgi:metacaspase-1
MNETILPADWETVGMIDDDTLHAILVKNLPAGCKFTAIFDSCHRYVCTSFIVKSQKSSSSNLPNFGFSGTVLDLPYIYKSTESGYENAHKAEGHGFMGRMKKDKFSITKIVSNEIGYQAKKKVRGALNKAINQTKADVIQFSGCRDEQTSADATIANQATGAMSYAFIKTLKASQGSLSYAQLLNNMRRELHNGPKQFKQVPQLSYGKNGMDMNQPFLL